MTPAEMLALADQAEARASKATPGPWSTHNTEVDYGCGYVDVTVVEEIDFTSVHKADAAFVAAARTDVPALCAALREAAARLERAEARRSPPTDREVLEMARKGAGGSAPDESA